MQGVTVAVPFFLSVQEFVDVTLKQHCADVTFVSSVKKETEETIKSFLFNMGSINFFILLKKYVVYKSNKRAKITYNFYKQQTNLIA